MQTKKIAVALFAVALLFTFAGVAVAADTADSGAQKTEAKKGCCQHAKSSEGGSGAHCARHAKNAEGAACPHHADGKACCAEHEKSGKAGEECCCCDEACDRPAAKAKPSKT